MNRKYVYGLLAIPFVLILTILVLMPGETRAAFLTEFRHRARLMMGYEPKKYTDGEQGLRSEHPEEYGHAYDAEPSDGGELGTDPANAETLNDEEVEPPPADEDPSEPASQEESADEVSSTNPSIAEETTSAE